MATSQALTRHRTPVPAPRAARQAVPAFLQKLHEMVNDPNNGDLIRWSEAGDSFYVLDHERFAREVLGRWFKHQNFASFVRQLNMYGFHKIPHLQQGVLRSDTDTEFWNFAHPNFHRGQPDLLCLIQRKKQTAQPGEEPVMEIRESSNIPQTAQTNPHSGQVVDINSIVNGIATLKRHQSAISKELNDLKRSNQLLWQNAMEARAKHEKQQVTIERIVFLLAGVFGHHATQHKDDGVESVPSRAVIPRKKSRFLIEDGRSREVTIEDERHASESDAHQIRDPVYTHDSRIETPHSIPSPTSDNVSSDPFIEAYNSSTEIPHPPLQPKSSPPSTTPVDKTYSPPTPLPEPTTFQPKANKERSVTPTRSPVNMEFDPRIQMYLNQLTPGQISQLLSSLSHVIDPMSAADSSSSQLTQYTPSSDLFNQFIDPLSSSAARNAAPIPSEGLSSFDNNQDAINLQNAGLNNVSRSWKATEDIERDVNAINSDLDTFIRGLGLDPQHLDTNSAEASPSSPPLNLRPDDTPMDSVSASLEAGVTPEASAPSPGDVFFDIDTFLNSFSGNAGGADTSFSTDGESFPEVDHVPTLDTGPVLHQPGPGTPDSHASPSATKRKTDVSDHATHVPSPEPSMSVSAKPSKRSRHK